MVSQEQWFALHVSGYTKEGYFDDTLAYSQDMDKLRSYATQRSNKELKWRQGAIFLNSQARCDDGETYDIVPDKMVVILL